jgi:hypothetical protein
MRRRPPAPLAILLAVATIQFLAWVVVLPALQAPDEQTHFAYTQRLLETGHKPPLDGDANPFSPEVDAAWYGANLGPTIGNLSSRTYWTELDERLWRGAAARLGPDGRDLATGPTGASHNPPLYYAYAGIGYAAAWNGSFFDRLYAMRLVNLPLYLITIVMTWVLAGRLLGPALWPRTIAAGAVAVLPQFAFVAAGISPDLLLTAIWSVFAVVAVDQVQRQPTWRGTAAVIALALAALATHPRGAPLVFLAVLTIALARRDRIAALPRRLKLALTAAVAGVVAVVLAGLIAVAGVLDTTSGAGFNARQFVSYVWQFYLPRLPFMDASIGPDYGARQAFVESFYGVFASLEVRWPARVYDLLELASLIGLVTLVVVLVRGREVLRRRWPVTVLVAAMPLTLIAALHFAAYRNLVVAPNDPVIVGRYLFPLLPLFGVAIAIVVRALPQRASLAVGTTLLTTGALLGLSGLGMTVVRFYV